MDGKRIVDEENILASMLYTKLDWRDYCRDVPDFPKKGIMFKDITPILNDPLTLKLLIKELTSTLKDFHVDYVASMESRGFIIGAPVACNLGAGFIPIRKTGKLPWKTYSEEYDLEYGMSSIEIHQDACKPGKRVVIIDDVLATGGTACAAIKLLKKCDAKIIAAVFPIELNDLGGRKKIGEISDIIVSSLMQV